ncbi:MAG: 4-alpha-glucanotransferase, partial [Candidatus Angelobacter sp.]
MSFPRSTGILLHPISLPSGGGIGDLGGAAYEFVDFLASARQGLWQVLPLGPPANGNSPYSSTSAFAGNPLLISLERLAEHGWFSAGDLAGICNDVGPIDYEAVSRVKLPLLERASRNFLERLSGNAKGRFENFCLQNQWWLEDFVLFDSLRTRYAATRWDRWPRKLARHYTEELDVARQEHAAELAVRRVIQFFFYEQWNALRQYCAQRSIRIVGDIAIFVDYDSADVWA